MKFQKIIVISYLILIMIFFLGCSSYVSSTRTPPMQSQNSATVILRLPPSATITPKIIPILPVDKAQKMLLQILLNNNDCSLPCLWGLTPGESTYQDAKEILMPLSSISSFITLNARSGAIDLSNTDGDLTIRTSLRFSEKSDSNVIDSISFSLESLKDIDGNLQFVFDSTVFGKKANAYMLPSVLSAHGIPTAALISTWSGPPTRGGQDGFYLLLLYPDQGILTYYTTYWKESSTNVLGCLSNANVEMELFPSGNGESFSKFLAPTNWAGMWPEPVDNPYWKPIEKATTMTLEQFYETFRQPTDKCIETPTKLWLMPEP